MGTPTKSHCCRVFCCFVLCGFLASGAVAAPIQFDFDVDPAANSGQGDGQDPEGWTALVGAADNHGAASGNGAGGRRAAGEDSQHQGLLLVSPGFTLDPASTDDLSFQLSGGRGDGVEGSWTPPTSQSQVLGDIAAKGGLSNVSGKQGLALALLNTGEYVLTKEKSLNQNAWQSLSFTRAELDNLISTYGTHQRYSLHYIEYGHGGWGHTELDSVSVPAADVAPRVANASFEGPVTRGWDSFNVSTVTVGQWHAPLFGDRMAKKSSGGLPFDYLSNAEDDPRTTDAGTYFYQALEGSSEAWIEQLVFDYLSTDGRGDSPERNLLGPLGLRRTAARSHVSKRRPFDRPRIRPAHRLLDRLGHADARHHRRLAALPVGAVQRARRPQPAGIGNGLFRRAARVG
jgi:hypothetical protein